MHGMGGGGAPATDYDVERTGHRRALRNQCVPPGFKIPEPGWETHCESLESGEG